MSLQALPATVLMDISKLFLPLWAKLCQDLCSSGALPQGWARGRELVSGAEECTDMLARFSTHVLLTGTTFKPLNQLIGSASVPV